MFMHLPCFPGPRIRHTHSNVSGSPRTSLLRKILALVYHSYQVVGEGGGRVRLEGE